METKKQLAIFLKTARHVYGISVITVFILAFSIFTLTQFSPKQNATPSNAQIGSLHDVVFDGTSYTPSTLTVEVGDTIRFTNIHPTEYTQVSSDPHPVHTNYPGMNMPVLSPNGGTDVLVITTVGTYGYHDHLHPSTTGTIIVTAIHTTTPTHTPTATPTPTATATNTPTPSTTFTPTQIPIFTPTKTLTPTVTIKETPFTTVQDEEMASFAPFVLGGIFITLLLGFGLYYYYVKQKRF